MRVTEGCYECQRDKMRCANHVACDTEPDARHAANVGVGWAEFTFGQLPPVESIHLPWPVNDGRCAAIARELTEWLSNDKKRRIRLAELCWWRAQMRWCYLVDRFRIEGRDQPYRPASGRGAIYCLPGQSLLHIHFRTPRRTVRFTRPDSPWPERRKRIR